MAQPAPGDLAQAPLLDNLHLLFLPGQAVQGPPEQAQGPGAR